MLLAGSKPQPITVNGTHWPDPLNYLVASQFFFDEQIRTRLAEIEDVPTIVEISERPRQYNWKSEREGSPTEPHMYWKGSSSNLLRRVVHELMTTDVTAPIVAPDACPVPSLRSLVQHWSAAHEELQTRIQRIGKQPLLRWRLPGWLKYPHIPRGSIGWRMGYGESYMYELHDWLQTLPADERQAYESAYPHWPDVFTSVSE